MGRRPPTGPTAVALVGVGGAVGASARHLVTLAMPTPPLGTLAVNVVGSFVLALVLSDGPIGTVLGPRQRLTLASGLLSSFTTYSTFALESTTLTPSLAVGYVAANYGLAMGAALAGHGLARWWA